jgi:hypothetical protein
MRQRPDSTVLLDIAPPNTDRVFGGTWLTLD